MSEIWVPPSVRPKNVQIAEKERVCVLVHSSTGRILCFCRDDPFASMFTQKGYIKHEIHHAHEYDMWAKRLREQSKMENEAEDCAYLERENKVRQSLRSELRKHMLSSSGAQRQAVESALHCLDYMEEKRKRVRAESFMVQEAYEDKTNAGEEIINDLMSPKASAKTRRKNG